MDFQTILNRLEKIEKKQILTEATLTLQQVQAAEKAAADQAAADRKQGGFKAITTWDPKTAGDIALSKLATDNGLPGLINSKGEFVVAGDGTQKPQIAPPNADDMKALSAAGLMPGNTQGPSAVTKFLGDPKAALAGQPTQGDKELAQAKQQSANVQGAKSSAEFIRPRLLRLKALIDIISSNTSESISFKGSIARSLVESFDYKLDEKVTLGTGAPTTNPATGVTSGKFQKEVAEIKQLMAELADIDDVEVTQTLTKAQAALDKLSAPVAQAGGTQTNKLPNQAPTVSASPAASAQPAASGQDLKTIDPNKLKRFKELLDKAEKSSAGPAQTSPVKPQAAVQTRDLNAPASSGATPASAKPTWQTIYAANKQVIGADPNKIKPGQQLKMPDGSTYTVKAGDNLSKIAANFKPAAGSSANPPAQPKANRGQTSMMGNIDAAGLPENPMP